MLPLIGACVAGAIGGEIVRRVSNKREERKVTKALERHPGYRPYLSPKSPDWKEFCRDHPRLAAAILEEYAEQRDRAEDLFWRESFRTMRLNRNLF